MTAQQMIEKVEAIHRKQIGANFDPARVRSVIEAGYDAIADGTIIGGGCGQSLVKVGQTVECRKDGVVVKVTQLDDAGRCNALMGHAYTSSRIIA